ncbi:MAG: hypothetical protein KOO63_02855 [Bacteroidales bacterium]|nr:hypothetical protein [Candidatus Latescibacterota bacterium]
MKLLKCMVEHGLCRKMRESGKIFHSLFRMTGIFILFYVVAALPAGAATDDGTIPIRIDQSRDFLFAPVTDLAIQSIQCSFDTVRVGDTGIPLTVRLQNRSDIPIIMDYVSINFSLSSGGDRNSDYFVTTLPIANDTIYPTDIVSFDFLIDVLPDALIGEIVRISAFAVGERSDSGGTITVESSDTHNILDEFEAVAWDNDDGSEGWLDPWTEIGESDGPDTGFVFISSTELRIGSDLVFDVVGIERGADLSDIDVATLKFKWASDPLNKFQGLFLSQISDDGGENWVDLVSIEGGASMIAGEESLDITEWAGAETRIRFVTSDLCQGFIYIDEVEIIFEKASASYAWVVLNEGGLQASIALLDTRFTPDRSDDSLIVLLEKETTSLGIVYRANQGVPVASIQYEHGREYRLVMQYRNLEEWEWEVKDSERGYFAFEDISSGFGRESEPRSGLKEFLLTETNIGNEEDDPVDCVIGATTKSDPPPSWDIMSDPWSDPEVDEGKVGEFGSIIEGLTPPRWILDCKDGGKDWEVTGKAEADRSYFHEIWFRPDQEWEHGDLADIYLHYDGNSPENSLNEFHMIFRMVDDDTLGPEISDYSPETIPEWNDIYITTHIFDPSGVYDDDTDEGGQGVYIIWDDDGSLLDGYNVMQMFAIGGGYFQTIGSLGSYSEGIEILYRVYAYDDDSDSGSADRSQSVSEVHSVQVIGSSPVYETDSSISPDEIYPDMHVDGFQLLISNPNADEIVLMPAVSYLTLTDGVLDVNVNLVNETVLRPGVNDYTIVFDQADIPEAFNAPDTVEVDLHLEGTIQGSLFWSQDWTLSESNRIIVDAQTVFVEAYPLPSPAVNPGDRNAEMLRLKITNKGLADVLVDSLVVDNLTTGTFTVPGNDVNFETLYLYRQNESIVADQSPAEGGVEDLLKSRPFDEDDSLAATAVFSDGKAVFRLSQGNYVSIGEEVYYYVTADIDSFLACDGDLLDIAVMSTDSIFLAGNGIVESDQSILNSEGISVVDGFVNTQAAVLDVLPDTLWSGVSEQLIFAIELPSNGYAPDLLTELALHNYGSEAANAMISDLMLWVDDGDYIFSSDEDEQVGELVFTGGVFVISGISVPVVGSRLLFVTSSFGGDFLSELMVRIGLPVNGATYVSGNEGPINMEILSPVSQVLLKKEFLAVSIMSRAGPEYFYNPGDRAVELTGLSMENSTLSSLILESLSLRGNTDMFECVPGQEIDLYLDDGDMVLDTSDDTWLISSTMLSGVCEFSGLDTGIEPGDQIVLFAAIDVDSFLTPDGDTLSIRLESAGDIVISSVAESDFSVEGEFPLAPEISPVSDGMMSYQLGVYSGSDSTMTGRLKDILAMEIVVPGNGCRDDILESVRVINIGTARENHIETLWLWRDNGDEKFSAIDDIKAGSMITDDFREFIVDGLSEPVSGDGNSTFFITVDLNEGFTSGADIWLQIPVNGISMSSGNDGPIDESMTTGQGVVIPVPDRVTVYSSLLGNKRVRCGDRNILNMVLGVYNSYSDDKMLKSLILLKEGTSFIDEIELVQAWADANGNGLFDVENDLLLETVDPEGAIIIFDGLDLALGSFKNSLLFITYDLPGQGVRDSVSIDFSISDRAFLEFNDDAIKVEGVFPLESAGTDYTDGMKVSQISIPSLTEIMVSPDDEDVFAYSLTIPCNGSENDILRNISFENEGSALVGMDVGYLRLWRETGGSSPGFDEGEEELITYLSWNGSSWSSFSGLDEYIGCDGLSLHVTVDITATASDGRILMLDVPANGIEVASGNDGPIDGSLGQPVRVVITTDPLVAGFESLLTVTSGQEFDLGLRVANVADSTIVAIRPSGFDWSGTGSIIVESGPTPGFIDLSGQEDSMFTWSMIAGTPGFIIFEGMVEGEYDTESMISRSDTLFIQGVPGGFNMTLDDLAPVSLNRGTTDVGMIEFTMIYSGSCLQCAPIDLGSVELIFKDAAGQPLGVSDIATVVYLRDEVMLIADINTTDIEDSAVTLVPFDRVMIEPGGMRTFRVYIDVGPETSGNDFRISLGSASAFDLIDHNTGIAVEIGGIEFPWTTNAVDIREPALELSVGMDGIAPETINRGQEDVRVFSLVLTNVGSSSGADISISSICFEVEDIFGSSTEASGIFSEFHLQDGPGYRYCTVSAFGASQDIECVFQPEIVISPGMPLVLDGYVDLVSHPAPEGFRLVLQDSLCIGARDANSGQTVTVRSDQAGGYDFPMDSGGTMILNPLTGLSVSGTSMLPDAVTASSVDVDALNVVIRHTGSQEESSALLRSLSIRLLDSSGSGIPWNSTIEGLRSTAGDSVAGEVYPAAGDTSSYMTLVFPGDLQVSPGDSIDIDISVDLEGESLPPDFQMQVAQSGIEAYDATSMERFISVQGEFPLTSGIAEITLPADGITFGAGSIMPSNVVPGEKAGLFKLRFSRDLSSEGSHVIVSGFDIEFEDRYGIPIDPSAIIEDIIIENEGTDVGLTMEIVSGTTRISLVDPVMVEKGQSIVLDISAGISESTSIEALRAEIPSVSSIVCVDGVSDESVAVSLEEGFALPFISGMAAVIAGETEASFSNYPNPFIASQEQTRITFFLPSESEVSLEVYTITGKLVKKIIDNESMMSGLHQDIWWDGRNGRGEKVLNGVYYLVLKTGAGGSEKVFRRKAALVR